MLRKKLTFLTVFLFSFFLLDISLVYSAQPVTTITSSNTNIELISMPFETIKQNEPLYVRFWAFNTSTGTILTNNSIYCTINILEPQGKNVFRTTLRTSNFGLEPSYACKSCWWYNITGGNFTKLGLHGLNLRCQTLDNQSLGGASMIPFIVTEDGLPDTTTDQSKFISSISNTLLYSIYFIIVLVLILFMHIFKEEKGTAIVYGNIATALSLIMGTAILSGFNVFNNIVFIIDINKYLMLLSYALAIYTGTIAYSFYSQTKKDNSDYMNY